MFGRPRYCKSCAVARRADQSLAAASARVMLEEARRLKAEDPDEWARMMAEAEAGKEMSDVEMLEMLTAFKEAEDEALRRMVEGEG